MRDQRGTVLVKFALGMVVFFMFICGLIVVSLWGLGAMFTQEAAHTAFQEYAVRLDTAEATAVARSIFDK